MAGETVTGAGVGPTLQQPEFITDQETGLYTSRKKV